jgi:hypothetical protein
VKKNLVEETHSTKQKNSKIGSEKILAFLVLWYFGLYKNDRLVGLVNSAGGSGDSGQAIHFCM